MYVILRPTANTAGSFLTMKLTVYVFVSAVFLSLSIADGCPVTGESSEPIIITLP